MSLDLLPLNVLVVALGGTQAFYLMFLAYAAINRARREGKPIHWLTYVLAGPPIAAFYVFDVCWNCVIGSLIFFEPPWKVGGHPLKWTFTRRLRSHKDDAGWRGKVARFFAELLNTFDPGHV